MINDYNVQRSIVISKEIDKKIRKEAEENFSSKNCIIRKIINDYYKNKENKNENL